MRSFAYTSALAIICVTHESRDALPTWQAAVGVATVDPSTRVVIVDSGSSDAFVTAMSSSARSADVCLLDGNRGYAAGINAGIHHVRETGGARAYVVMNPDVWPEPGSLDRLVRALDVDGVGISCPQLRDEAGRLQLSLRNPPSLTAAWSEALFGGPLAERLSLPTEVVREPRRYEAEHVVGWATGGLLAVSDECSLAVGPWDETLFLYDEEVDFCLRAADAGFTTWYVPEASAVRADDGVTDPWRQALMRRNRVRLVSRRTRLGAFGLVAALVVGDVLRAARGRPEARAGLWAVLRRATPQQILQRYAPEIPEPPTDSGGPQSRFSLPKSGSTVST